MKTMIQLQRNKSLVTQKIADELNKNNIHVDIDKYAGTIKISDLELFELNSWELSENGKTFIASTDPQNNTAPQRYFDYFVSYGNSDNFVENQPLPDQGSFYVKVNYEDLLRAGYVTDGYIYIKNYGKVSLTLN